MTEPSVATDVHEAFNVHGHLGSQSTLDLEIALDLPADAIHVFVREIMRADVGVHTGDSQDLVRPRPTYAKDVSEGNFYPLPTREVNA